MSTRARSTYRSNGAQYESVLLTVRHPAHRVRRNRLHPDQTRTRPGIRCGPHVGCARKAPRPGWRRTWLDRLCVGIELELVDRGGAVRYGERSHSGMLLAPRLVAVPNPTRRPAGQLG
jgi:hypothetical protein